MAFMELQELYRNKILGVFFLTLLFLFSCTENKGTLIKRVAKNIPPIYMSNASDGFLLHQDTLWLKNESYNGYVFELALNKIDTLFFAGYINGLLEGEVKKWHPNKQLWEKRWYNAGKKNGLQQSYWENGIKRFEFIANEDVYEGEMKEWAQNGLLVHLANYVNGQEDGTQKSWYSNGKIKSNYFIIKGKRYGLLGTKNCKNVSDSIFNIK